MTFEQGIYRHFKGNLYYANEVVLNTQTDKENVVYYPLYESEHKGFTRPLEEWNEVMDRTEFSGPRFTKILDWKEPNILLGSKAYHLSEGGESSIIRVSEREINGPIVITLENNLKGTVDSVPLTALGLYRLGKRRL